MESSYETGGGSFRPNKDRGFWSNPSDFLFACLSNSIRMDCLYALSIVPLIANGGILMLFICLLNLLLYSLPIIFIQTFLGQFSSSGFISVFRIAPLFKGLGYIGLCVNLFSLTYFSVFAAVPILLFIHSLQPTLPWSCERHMEWMPLNESFITPCNRNHSAFGSDLDFVLTVPSAEYFADLVKTFSFSLFACAIGVWIAVAFALCNTTEKIGKIFRYCTITIIILLAVVCIRMIILPGVRKGLIREFTEPKVVLRWEILIVLTPMLMHTAFGPGWGSVLTMASYNKFETRISKYSVLLCFAHFGILLLIGMVCMFTELHLTQNNRLALTPVSEMHWGSFFSIPSSLATLEYPHLWTWMFFAVLIIGSFSLMIVQMFAVLTALFDEYEKLRSYKKGLIFGMSGILALVSALFCTEDGIYFVNTLAELNSFSQGFLNFFLLSIIVWVYGRDRFQRDVKFLTNQVLATWKVYIVRFATQICVSLSLFLSTLLLIFSYNDSSEINLMPYGSTIAFLPWLILPAYCVYNLMKANGTIGKRFKRCTRPVDWYPLDPEYRLQYEEAIDSPETDQPLTSVVL